MDVWEAKYDVDEEQDGSLKWSRVSGVKRHGVLWEPGMASPWKPPAAEIPGDRQDHAAYDRLLLKDPFTQPSRGSRSRGRRGGRGSARGGGRRGRGRVDAHAGLVDDDGAPGGLAADIGGPADRAHDGQEMDLLDHEAEEAEQEGMNELRDTYGIPDGDLHAAPPGLVGHIGGDLEPDPVFPEDAQDLADEVAEGAADVAGGIGLEPDDDGPAAEVEVLPPAPPPEDDVWEGPSISGYCYLGGRSVLRIQRGAPANSVTVSCYKHPSCRMCLSEARCPSNDGLKAWYHEGETPSPDATTDEKRLLAKQHMKLGMDRWSAKAAKAKAKAHCAS